MHPGKRYGLRGPLAAFMDRIPSFLHPCNAREDEGHRVKRSMTVSNRGIFHDTPNGNPMKVSNRGISHDSFPDDGSQGVRFRGMVKAPREALQHRPRMEKITYARGLITVDNRTRIRLNMDRETGGNWYLNDSIADTRISSVNADFT